MKDYEIDVLCDKNKYLSLVEAKCPDGKKWAYAKRANANNVVIIVPLIMDLAEPSTMFLKTSRPPLVAEKIAEFNLEFPAGLVGDENKNETIEEALKKELLEETGMQAEKFVIKNSLLSSSAGCICETAVIALAYIKNSKIVKMPVSDGGVISDRIIVNLSEIKDFLKERENSGWAIGAQTLAGIYYLYEEIEVF